jgi:hypothetical protein
MNEVVTIRVDLFDVEEDIRYDILEEIHEMLKGVLEEDQYDLVVFDEKW